MNPNIYNKIGFHAGPAGNHNGIGDYYRELDSIGVPFVIKSVDHYGHIYESEKYKSADHARVFRLSTRGQNDGFDYDVPGHNYTQNPNDAAERHWAHTLAKLPPEFNKELVWLEVINEVDKNHAEWLAVFALRIGILALRDGFKVLLFGWSPGEPELEHWESSEMHDFLMMCEDYPDQVGIALHEYSLDANDIWSAQGYHIGRFRYLFDHCEAKGLQYPTTIMTEWGWTHRQIPSPQKAMQQIEEVAGLYARYPAIKGAAIWYLGGGSWGDIANQTQRLIEPVREFSKEWEYTGDFDTGWEDNQPPWDGDIFLWPPYKRILMLHPQQLDTKQRGQIMDWMANGLPDGEQAPGYAGWSHQDAFEALHQSVMRGAADSRLYVIDGQAIGTGMDREWVEANFPHLVDYVYYLSTGGGGLGPPPIIEKMLPVPHLWQNSPTATLANDCGPACAAMAVHYFTNHRPTVDQMSQRMGKDDGSYTDFNQMDVGMNSYGANGIYQRPMRINDIKASIADEKPVIVLLKYGELPKSYRKFTDFTGWHFMVAIGYDAAGRLYFNDPLRQDGRMVALSETVIDRAMGAPGGNMPYQGMKCEKKQTTTPPPPPNTTPLPIGLHASATPDVSEVEHGLFSELQPKLIKLLSFHDPHDVARLANAHPDATWVVRAFLSMNGRDISPEQFVNDTMSDLERTIDFLPRDNVLIEIHNEPNLRQEGYGTSWHSAAEFNVWYLDVLARYRQTFWEIPMLFPGLSPGHAFDQRPVDHMTFLDDCIPAINQSDGLGVHSYWSEGFPMVGDVNSGITLIDIIRGMVPNKPFWITEASHNGAQTPMTDKGAQYASFLAKLGNRPYVKGCAFYVASAHGNDFPYEVWVKDGKSTGILEGYLQNTQ